MQCRSAAININPNVATLVLTKGAVGVSHT
jgi:hypothetical protein